MRTEFICIVCPEGCRLIVIDGEVTGNNCVRGIQYGKTEATDPRRVVTSSIRLPGGVRCPVKTSGAVRKADMDSVIAAIHSVRTEAPIKVGDVLIRNVAGSGVDIVATANR